MGDQCNTEHDAADQSRMLVGRHQTDPTCGLQPEITFGPGKVPLNDCARALMKAPLVEKEQCCQEMFATPTKVVVDHESGVQDYANPASARTTVIENPKKATANVSNGMASRLSCRLAEVTRNMMGNCDQRHNSVWTW
jgi:hypothetical protein